MQKKPLPDASPILNSIEVLHWYQSALRQAQIIGLLMGSGGVLARFQPLISLILLLLTAGFAWRYWRHPIRRQLKLAEQRLPSKERTWLSVSIQSMCLFTLLLAFVCALTIERSVTQMLLHPLLRATLLFAGVGFYGQWHMQRYLKRQSNAASPQTKPHGEHL